MPPYAPFANQQRAGAGFVLAETREETRFIEDLAVQCPTSNIYTIAAPGGQIRAYRLQEGAKEPSGAGLPAAYALAAASPNNILVVYDLHTLFNNAGQWRLAIEMLPYLRSPKGLKAATDPETMPCPTCRKSDALCRCTASMVIAVGPQWELNPANPLKGAIPVIEFAPPTRAALAQIAAGIRPLNGQADAIADALCGLTADAAQQAAAECLSACGDWNADHLRAAKRKMVSDAGLLVMPGIREIAGLKGFKDYTFGSILPWSRDDTIGVRRLCLGGKPGTGKTFAAQWLAGQLGTDLYILDLSQLQGSLVGQSQAATRSATQIIDAVGTESPAVVLLDEFDTIAKSGHDGGAASGQWSWLVGWLQRTLHHQSVLVAASNYPDRIDAAMLRRFPIRFRFEYPDLDERTQVAEYHYGRVKLAGAKDAARVTAAATNGCSAAQLAEEICPEVARRTARKAADATTITEVVSSITPAANVNTDQLAAMEKAVAGWRLANTPAAAVEAARPTGRRIRTADAN